MTDGIIDFLKLQVGDMVMFHSDLHIWGRVARWEDTPLIFIGYYAAMYEFLDRMGCVHRFHGFRMCDVISRAADALG